MPSWQFQTHLNPNQTVSVPPEIVAQLSSHDSIQVVLTTGATMDDEAWKLLAAEQFLQGYAPSDDVYDELQAG